MYKFRIIVNDAVLGIVGYKALRLFNQRVPSNRKLQRHVGIVNASSLILVHSGSIMQIGKLQAAFLQRTFLL